MGVCGAGMGVCVDAKGVYLDGMGVCAQCQALAWMAWAPEQM